MLRKPKQKSQKNQSNIAEIYQNRDGLYFEGIKSLVTNFKFKYA